MNGEMRHRHSSSPARFLQLKTKVSWNNEQKGYDYTEEKVQIMCTPKTRAH